MGAGTIGCIIGSNMLSRKEIASLTAAYMALGKRVKVRDNVNDWWNYLEHSGLGKEQKGHKKLRKAKQKLHPCFAKPPTKSTPDRR